MKTDSVIMDKLKDIYEISYMFGYSYFGPFLIGFIKWISEIVDTSEIDNIFFFARDGYMMKRAYELYTNKSDTYYAYFSRNSIRQALLYRSRTFTDSLQYLTKERYVSLNKLLKYYGFTPSECNQIAIKNSMDLNAEFKYEDIYKLNVLKKIYQENLDIIKSKSKDKASLLRKYLMQIGFEGNCAIIDIGWHGSMQFYLEKFLEFENIGASIIGIYVGIDPIEKLKGTVHGYVYNPKDLKMRKKLLCFLGGYEKLFQSLDGSTNGYELKNGHIFPVLTPYEYENDFRIKSIISQWQKGALRYVESHKTCIICEKNKLIIPLINFGINPPKWGLKLFEAFYLEDGEKQYFLPQKKINEYKIKELLHSLSNSVWKTGFMKSLLKIPLPYYWIYYMLRK